MDLSNDHGTALAPPSGPSSALERLVGGGSTHAERASEAVNLAALWTELVSGHCKVEELAFTERTCSLVVTRSHRTEGAVVPLSKRHTEILQRSLVEGARKSLAVDLGLCPSSVAEILKHGFTFMGLSCWPSRIPFPLVMAAHASRAKELERNANVLVAANQSLLRQTITVTRPDGSLAARLTPAEYTVTRLLVEGKSYQEMAALRQTSARTVANQLAAAFHRLGVSGRAELLCLLAAEKVASWRISTPTARAPRAATPAPTGFLRVAGWNGR